MNQQFYGYFADCTNPSIVSMERLQREGEAPVVSQQIVQQYAIVRIDGYYLHNLKQQQLSTVRTVIQFVKF